MPLPKRHRRRELYSAWCFAALSTTAAAEIPWNLRMVNADVAHTLGYTGSSVVVGIIDTDLDATHPAFKGRIDSRSRSFLSPHDPHIALSTGHGTYVAGVIGASKNIGPMYGIAYDATLLGMQAISVDATDHRDNKSCRRYGLPSTQALHYAAELNLKVLNGSYGPRALPSRTIQSGFNFAHQVLPYHIIVFNDAANETLYMPEYQAIEAVAAADTVMVFAAGNDYRVQPLASLNPSGNGLLPYIRPENHDSGIYRFISNTHTIDQHNPNTYSYLEADDSRLARLDFSNLQGKLITVVSTDSDGKIASYSNRCGVAWQWCIAAPGGDAPYNNEKSILSTTLVSRGLGGYDVMSGTSLATALVAGSVALVRGAFPHLNASQSIELLLSSADNTGIYADKAIYGRGMLNVGRAVIESR